MKEILAPEIFQVKVGDYHKTASNRKFFRSKSATLPYRDTTLNMRGELESLFFTFFKNFWEARFCIVWQFCAVVLVCDVLAQYDS